MLRFCFFFFFFFKQKTAYEMRISDWSSDVCSSDLLYPRDRDRRALGILEDVEAEGSDCRRVIDIAFEQQRIDAVVGQDETLDIVEIAGEKFAAIGRDQPPVGRYAGERLAIEIIALARFAREAIGLGFRTGAERAGDRKPRGDLRRVGEIEHAQPIIALGRGAVVGERK